MFHSKVAWFGVLCFAAVSLCTIPAAAHQLWIETHAAGNVGHEQQIHVCFGHSGEKATGELLEKYKSKSSAWAVRPDGSTETLKLALGHDSYTATITPDSPGYHMLGAELQAGIIDKEFHGIPANTRIVMYGKSFTHVAGSERALDNTLGFDLEIVPLTDLRNLHAGDVVTAKVLLKGKPVGGRNVMVSLSTSGPEPATNDPGVHAREWSIEAHADRRTGQISFPLIVGGQHVFHIKYIDETPGTYEGERNEASEFSHLRKGDAFERTMYVSTFAMEVKVE